MTGVVLAWAVELGLITWRGFRKGAPDNVGGLPLPADYLATFAIFGTLSLFGGVAEKPATVAAWGYIAATALNLFDPTFNRAGKSTTNSVTGNTFTNPQTQTKSAGPIAARPPIAANVL